MPEIYTFSREGMDALVEDHRRLRAMVRNLESRLSRVTHESGIPQRTIYGVTSVSEEFPDYPLPAGDGEGQPDTFVVKVQDVGFTPEPGRQAGGTRDTGSCVVARTHGRRYLPKDTPVLVVEVRTAYGLTHWIVDGPERQHVVELVSYTGMLSDGSDYSESGGMALDVGFSQDNPAALIGWNHTADLYSHWLVKLNSCLTEWDAATIEIQRGGLYEVHITWQPRAAGDWAANVVDNPEDHLLQTVTTSETSGHTHTVTSRNIRDFVGCVRGELQAKPPTGGWGDEGYLSLIARLHYGSPAGLSGLGWNTNDVFRAETSAAFGVFEWSAGTRLRWLVYLDLAPDADARGWIREARILLRYLGDSPASTPSTFCQAGSGTTTSSSSSTTSSSSSTSSTSSSSSTSSTSSSSSTSSTSSSSSTSSTSSSSSTSSTSTTTAEWGACCFYPHAICNNMPTEQACIDAGGYWTGGGPCEYEGPRMQEGIFESNGCEWDPPT